MSYLVVQGQHGMAFDDRRNQFYAEALKNVITPESVVLDIGCGLGIHGLLAAQLGAKRVYMVEPEDIVAVAEEIAQANGFGDRIQCFKGRIEEVDIPEKVDVIISVFTGNFLLEEDLLPSLFYARDKYLKPGGVLVPDAAVMEAVPISAPELYAKEIEVWSNPHRGLVQDPARAYASHSVFYRRKELAKAVYLAEPMDLKPVDFRTATTMDCKAEVDYTMTQAGLCHGMAGWFRMKLGDQWLSTALHEPPLHWSAAYLPLDPAVAVEVGDRMTFKVQRPPGGDWTWTVKTAQTTQQRSTFFATPRTLATFKKLAPTHQPHLNDRGQATAFILAHSDGSQTIASLGRDLLTKFPRVCPDEKQALQFVQNLMGCFQEL
jgi:SAM-dependent methyltransferase